MASKPTQKKLTKRRVTKQVSQIFNVQDDETDSDLDDIDIKLQPTALQKPPNQIDLSEEELKKDVTIILRASNPYFSENFVEFSFKDLSYKPVFNFPNTVFFYSQRGTIEHKIMLDDEDLDKRGDDSAAEELDTKRKNKFNFCDRAIQTINLLNRDQCLQTEPPPQLKFEATASPAEIIISYQEKEQANVSKKTLEKKNKVVKKVLTKEGKIESFQQHRSFFKFCERMVDQNLLFEVNVDFSFYDNPSDEFMEKGLGSVLPLWKFTYRPMKGMSITSLTWNSCYSDMFAAGFGTFDLNLRHHSGCVCVYSLKCPSYPERIIMCKSSVHSVEFNPNWPHLLAVGFTEGAVAVYSLKRDDSTPIATNAGCKIEHNDIINQVKWLSDNVDAQHNFCSISADGKVINWVLAKSELIPSEVVNLKQRDSPTEGPEGIKMNATSGGTSISFNPDCNDMFIVGTEHGLIHKCSNLYTAQYISTYRDHSNNVYRVQWNPFHPRVFLSCSADWTIRIWDHTQEETSVFIFDLFNEVKDVTWAPFSSSLFAAVSKNGKVHLFDLMMNRQQPTCSYTVYSPKRSINLTTVQFNPTKPVIIVGDDRGCVISFKLSPNLRSSLKMLDSLEKSKFAAAEIDKMEKILRLAKSPVGKNNQKKMIAKT